MIHIKIFIKEEIKCKKIILSLFFIISLILLAIFYPTFSEFNYYAQNLNAINQLPNSIHWFGTDKFGRDLFIRVLYGARISLTIAISASLINILIGVFYGSIAGYFGGILDAIMMKTADAIYAIPSMLYIILLTVILGPSIGTIILAIVISSWIVTAKIIRSEVISLKKEDFVLAAEEFASPIKVIKRIILPNCTGTILTNLVFSIPKVIFAEAFLSFIGLGVPSPEASWGTLLSDALEGYQLYPYQLIFPAAAICITILAFNILGDGIRDLLCNKIGGDSYK